MATIILNPRETDRMLKVKSFIENNSSPINKFVMCDIVCCYNGMVIDETHSTSTVIDSVKKFFENMGFLVERGKYGGWDIYISKRMKDEK